MFKQINFLLGFSFLLFASFHSWPQPTAGLKEYNFHTFRKVSKVITAELLERTSPEYRNHPEFGIIPYRAQCTDCLELLNRRTIDSRFFIDPQNANHFYVQQAYTPLHYADKDGQWRTIDHHLQPGPVKDRYEATSLPVPTGYDFNRKASYIQSLDFTYWFNGRQRIFFIDSGGNKGEMNPASYEDATIGADGVYAHSAWDEIDVMHIYTPEGIKTTYVINKPLNNAASDGWLAFEDKVDLPDNFTVGNANGEIGIAHLQDEFFIGKNERPYIGYKQPEYFDAKGQTEMGQYQLVKEHDGWSIRTLVPVAWLNHPAVSYPVQIDPLVFGFDSIGRFNNDPEPPGVPNITGNMAFSFSPDFCAYDMVVQVPGKSELVRTAIDVEYTTRFTPNCGIRCRFPDLRQEVTVDPCGFIGSYSCDEDTMGLCTTDPRGFFGQGGAFYYPGLYFDSLGNPQMSENVLACIPPQCPDYFIPFTLRNFEMQCGDNCQTNCARGNYWAVTIEARTIELTIESDRDTVCVGEEVNLTSFPIFGVPPYNYSWVPTGHTDSISTVYPLATTTYIDTAFDICGEWAVASKTIVVEPTPEADAGEDWVICDGVSVIIPLGGNPTNPPGTTTEWGAVNPPDIAFLSSTTTANPEFNPPGGTFRDYLYAVRVQDTQDPFCFRYDTIKLGFYDEYFPEVIPANTQICKENLAPLQTSEPYVSYTWSNGESSPVINVPAGSYSVTVMDTNGCPGIANQALVTNYQDVPLTIQADPGTIIETGNSVTLTASINLLGSSVDTFSWLPTDILNCPDCASQTVAPVANQQYYLTIMTADGCMFSDTILIRVILPTEYAIPTAFSPNQDGINDRFFIIKASGVTVKEFKIFNRWGEMVHNVPQPWDGTFKDEILPMGTFTYFMVLQLDDGQGLNDVVEKGTVTLVK